MKLINRLTVCLAPALAAALVAPGAFAQAEPDERAIAQQLRTGDREQQAAALRTLQRLRTPPQNAELRAELIQTLKRETALRSERHRAIRQGKAVEPITDDIYGSTAQAVVAMRDPAAIPALAGAVGTGLLVVRALVEFGEPAAAQVLEAISSPGASVQDIMGGLLALRMMVENDDVHPLTLQTRDSLRSATRRYLTGRQSAVVIRRAIDLAVVLDDPGLRRIVEALASDRSELLTRGVTDPDDIERTQLHATDRLAGMPPLPRH